MKRTLHAALVALAVMGCGRSGQVDNLDEEVIPRNQQEQMLAQPSLANDSAANAAGSNVVAEQNGAVAVAGNSVENASGLNSAAGSAAAVATNVAAPVAVAQPRPGTGFGALWVILAAVAMILTAGLFLFRKRMFGRVPSAWARHSKKGAPASPDAAERGSGAPQAEEHEDKNEDADDQKREGPALVRIAAVLSAISEELRQDREERREWQDRPDWQEIVAAARQTGAMAKAVEEMSARLDEIEPQLTHLGRSIEERPQRHRQSGPGGGTDETPAPPTPDAAAVPGRLEKWVTELVGDFNAIASRYDEEKAIKFVARYRPQFVVSEGKAPHGALRNRGEPPLLALSAEDRGLCLIQPEPDTEVFFVLPSMTASRDWTKFYINNSGIVARKNLGDCFALNQGEHLAVETPARVRKQGNAFKLEHQGVLRGLQGA